TRFIDAPASGAAKRPRGGTRAVHVSLRCRIENVGSGSLFRWTRGARRSRLRSDRPAAPGEQAAIRVGLTDFRYEVPFRNVRRTGTIRPQKAGYARRRSGGYGFGIGIEQGAAAMDDAHSARQGAKDRAIEDALARIGEPILETEAKQLAVAEDC